MLSIQTYTPTDLSSFIRSFWYLKVPETLEAPYVEEILPDGHQEIIFHLNSRPARKRTGNEWRPDPAVFFAGQSRKSYTLQLNPGAVIYGVRFHPHTQALFYDFPAALSTDNLLSLSDVASKDDLPGCIDESPAKTFARLEKEFSKRATRLNKPGDAFLYVQAAVQKIIQQKGNIKIGLLQKFTGVSTRHLENAFQQYVGVSPKQFSNIIKFNHFISYKKEHPSKTLTDCAYEADFTDQSHLIKLSNLLTGQSPKAYFNKVNHINDFFLHA